jgi:hypothetical protein
VDAALNWFKDSAVVKGLNEEGKNWAKDLTSNSRPDADLLEHVAKFIAGKWLLGSFWPLSNTLLFVHSFVSKVSQTRKVMLRGCTENFQKIEARADPKRGNGWEDVSDPEEFSTEDIELMTNWAKNKYDFYFGLAHIFQTTKLPLR